MGCHRFAFVLLLAVVATAPAQAGIDDARAKGLKWLVQTQKGDGSFAGLQGLDTQSTAASVEAMISGGMTKSPQYARALSWLANAPGGSLDSRAWQAMTLAAAGRDATTIAGAIRDERNTATAKAGSITSGNTALWGPFPGYSASLSDTALAFGALRSAGVAYRGPVAGGRGIARPGRNQGSESRCALAAGDGRAWRNKDFPNLYANQSDNG